MCGSSVSGCLSQGGKLGQAWAQLCSLEGGFPSYRGAGSGHPGVGSSAPATDSRPPELAGAICLSRGFQGQQHGSPVWQSPLTREKGTKSRAQALVWMDTGTVTVPADALPCPGTAAAQHGERASACGPVSPAPLLLSCREGQTQD